MNKVLLFGGTGEGRALAEWMAARGIPHTVCVATEYGETLLPAGADVPFKSFPSNFSAS